MWGRPTLGLLVGLGLAVWFILGSPVLRIDNRQIRIERHGNVERVIPREKVDAVYRRGSKIVIESGSGRRRFEADVEGDNDTICAAFVEAGYPWEGPHG